MEVQIIYSEECPHCQELIQQLEKQSGIPGFDIDLVELSTEEAQKLIEDKNIDQVPTVINANGVFCEISYIGDRVELVCPT